MSDLAFIKMHGLGNDFVVVDARAAPLDLTGAPARAIADRRRGVGCDQVIVLEPPTNGSADVFMRILNADGGEAEACGNATRCIAAMVMEERGRDRAVVETVVGPLETTQTDDGRVSVDMGPVRTDWRDIPLAEARDTLNLGIAVGPLTDPVAVNVGNPHAVFFVDAAAAAPLAEVGPEVEHHPLFPARTNVQAVQVLAPDRLRVRVWERGVGITLASGSSAAATAVAAHRRGLTGRHVAVVLDGGELAIEWRDDNHVVQTGPWTESFRGAVPEEIWRAAE